MSKLPLSIRETAPHENAVKIESHPSINGLPGGIHTGGCWEWNGKVYKPLDGRPFANADCHYPTNELAFLEKFTGKGIPFFPKNWTYENRNGREWVVRDKAMIMGSDELPYSYLDRDNALKLESAIRTINRAGWEIGDDLQIGFDIKEYAWFIYDLSTAQEMNGSGAYAANERSKVHKIWELSGNDRLLALRENGKRVFIDRIFPEDDREVKQAKMKRRLKMNHVYGSFSRPFSLIWASLPDDICIELVQEDYGDWQGGIPHTWILSDKALPDDKVESYELTLCWNHWTDKSW